MTLAIVALAIIFSGLLLVAVLFLLRRMRKQQVMRGDALPSYHEARRAGARNNNPRGLTIQTGTPHGRSSILVINKDGQPMLINPESPPNSPDNIPQIHVTFPDEQDEQGRRKSGRVVVVRVGDGGVVGLEPVHEEQLPAYEKESKGQFYSIDMDQIGGLKEKANFH